MPRSGLTPASVAEEAARLSDELGLEQLSLSTVAKRVGVAVPSLYKHVNGADGLLREVAVLGASELGAALGRAAMGRSGAEAVRAVAVAYRDYAHAHPGRYAALQRAPEPDDDESAATYGAAVEVLLAVMRGFGIADAQLIHAVRMLRSALHGFVDLEARGGFGLPQDVDESYSLLVEGVIRALEHRSAQGR